MTHAQCHSSCTHFYWPQTTSTHTRGTSYICCLHEHQLYASLHTNTLYVHTYSVYELYIYVHLTSSTAHRLMVLSSQPAQFKYACTVCMYIHTYTYTYTQTNVCVRIRMLSIPKRGVHACSHHAPLHSMYPMPQKAGVHANQRTYIRT